MTPSIPDIRQYLTPAYGDEELGTFCSDYFRDVYENFTVGMSKAQKIQLLLDYCQRRDRLPNLLANLERDRPEQYLRRFGAVDTETGSIPTQPVTKPLLSSALLTPPVSPPAVCTLNDPIRLKLVRIPAGEFLMGSDSAVDKDTLDNEKPQHRVHLPDFYIGKVPATNAQFEAFVKAKAHKTTAEQKGFGWAWTGSKWEQVKGADWRHPRGPKTGIVQKADHPVVQVAWEDAVAFCTWLSEATGQAFRLPTEAEWDKAARGTDGRLYPWGDEPPDANRCNFNMGVGDTTPVGKYSMGATPDFGVLDVAGNVWEWCNDWYDADYYTNAPERNPPGPPAGQYRVLRGGSWSDSQRFVRAAVRSWDNPVNGYGDLGFRCVRSL